MNPFNVPFLLILVYTTWQCMRPWHPLTRQASGSRTGAVHSSTSAIQRKQIAPFSKGTWAGAAVLPAGLEA